ncbi:hypothetical protein QJS10_CPA08g01511 [Acorus calamus]|uniref:Protein YIP n=1 Tax=Acorus calamus TaxID=4465 RepID=A0AAV9E8S3_ACOCL|nr:hypothetical protein QJS10_CPA08g01511 [Acorus calamus]
MSKDFIVTPGALSTGGVPQQRRPGPTPMFQPPPPRPVVNPSLPFMSFDIGSASAPSSFSTPAFPGPAAYPSGSIGGGPSSFEDEPPLLEELGVNTRQIWRKTVSILVPFKLNPSLHEDADLSGPIIYVMAFGLFQLLAGKLHFGILLGWVTVASLFLYVVFNMLAGRDGDLDLYRCFSLVGYCMLPIVIFSAVALFLPQGGILMLSMGMVFALWSTRVCTRLLVELASGGDRHRGLIAYACWLIYTLFSLLVIF